jgi:Lrp/AsnC family transcriptional regulator for asnA, asnC and gidA
MTEIDDVDMAILKVVKENARLTAREISAKTDVPFTTVNRRFRKLVKNKVIKRFTVDLDYDQIGKRTIAYLLIRCHPGADYTDIYKKASKDDAVEDIQATAGQFDVILRVRVRDTDELSEFISNIRNLPSVAQTETLITLKLKK